MNKLDYIITRSIIAFTLTTVICIIFGCQSYGSEQLQPRSRYKIVKPVYLSAIYNNFDSKVVLGGKTGLAYLQAEKYYKKASVAFQCKVPAGTIMTIVGPAPKVLFIPFFPDRYLVKLEPDLSRGLGVILQLDRGFEGNLDGLNPELFIRLPKKEKPKKRSNPNIK